MSASRISRAVAATLAGGVLIFTAGCTEGSWRYESPPAAGVQADVEDAKVRNFMVISDEAGQALVLGTVAAMDSTELLGLTVSALDDEGAASGEPAQIELNEPIGSYGSVTLEGSSTKFDDPDLQLGRLANVTVYFSDGRNVSVETPIYSSEHPDFREAWNEVYG